MADPPTAGQFHDPAQQREAAAMGMWAFLTTEVLFFGGLLLAYAVYRQHYSDAFAEAGGRLLMWLGAANTAVLLTSSWTLVLGIDAAAREDRRRCLAMLGATAALGLVFLIVKAVEYSFDYREGLIPGAGFRTDWSTRAANVQLFYVLYFILTGLHAVHMLAGIGAVAVMMIRVKRADALGSMRNTLECTGLYWHFVDIVWVFLFPLLYLAGAG